MPHRDEKGKSCRHPLSRLATCWTGRSLRASLGSSIRTGWGGLRKGLDERWVYTMWSTSIMSVMKWWWRVGWRIRI